MSVLGEAGKQNRSPRRLYRLSLTSTTIPFYRRSKKTFPPRNSERRFPWEARCTFSPAWWQLVRVILSGHAMAVAKGRDGAAKILQRRSRKKVRGKVCVSEEYKVGTFVVWRKLVYWSILRAVSMGGLQRKNKSSDKKERESCSRSATYGDESSVTPWVGRGLIPRESCLFNLFRSVTAVRTCFWEDQWRREWAPRSRPLCLLPWKSCTRSRPFVCCINKLRSNRHQQTQPHARMCVYVWIYELC